MRITTRQHYSDEILIAFLDGETGWLRSMAVRRHLRVCWECRRRSAELEEQALAVTSAANSGFLSSVDTAAAKAAFLRKADELLQVTAPAQQRSPLTATLRRWPAPAAVALLAAALGLWQLRSPSTAPPDVRTLVKAAQAAEIAAQEGRVEQEFFVTAGQVHPFGEQRQWQLRVASEREHSRYTMRLEEAGGKLRLALWQPSAGERFLFDAEQQTRAVPVADSPAMEISLVRKVAGAATLAELERAFVSWLRTRRWHPVSLASESMHLASKDGTRATVETVRERGLDLVRITVHVTDGVTRTALTLELDAAAGTPQSIAIRIEAARTLELRMSPQRMVKAAWTDYSPDAALRPHPPAREFQPSSAAHPPAAGGAADSDYALRETQVLFALHQAHACMGEPLEVRPAAGGRILVRGVVGSGLRREEIATKFRQAMIDRLVKMEIRTSSEIYRELPAGSARSLSPPSAGRRRLSEDFQQAFGAPGEESTRAAERFAGEILSHSDNLAAEGVALRGLAARWTNAGTGRDADTRRRLLATMSRDHLLATQRISSALWDLLQARFPEAAAGAPAHPPGPNSTWFALVNNAANEIQGTIGELDRLMFERGSGLLEARCAAALARIGELKAAANHIPRASTAAAW